MHHYWFTDIRKRYWGWMITMLHRVQYQSMRQMWDYAQGAMTPTNSTPFEMDALNSLSKTWALTSLEDRLSYVTAYSYALLVQQWRNEMEKNETWVTNSWIPIYSSVCGSRTVLRGGIGINGLPLVFSSVALIGLIIGSYISLGPLRFHQRIARDGGLLNMITMLRDSSLPSRIAGDITQLQDDLRRRRAEVTNFT